MTRIGTLDIGDAEWADDLADVGAPMRARGRGAMRLPARRLIPRVPGVPGPGLRLQPLGFPTVTFTAVSGTVLRTTSRPQRPFKGKRLVVDIARTGATATGLITVNFITIGTDNQFVSSGPVGAAAFAPGAFDVNIELAAASTAIDITLEYATSLAPVAPDQIDVGTTLFGEAIGA